MSRTARLSEGTFNPESDRFDLSSAVDRIEDSQERTAEFGGELDFAEQRPAARVGRMPRASSQLRFS